MHSARKVEKKKRENQRRKARGENGDAAKPVGYCALLGGVVRVHSLKHGYADGAAPEQPGRRPARSAQVRMHALFGCFLFSFSVSFAKCLLPSFACFFFPFHFGHARAHASACTLNVHGSCALKMLLCACGRERDQSSAQHD